MPTRFNPFGDRFQSNGLPKLFPEAAGIPGLAQVTNGIPLTPDPLAGINMPLRLQKRAGFGATPDAPLGFYKPATPAMITFPIDATESDPYFIRVGTGVGSGTLYCFASTDPGGVVYLGPRSGNNAMDAGTLCTAITTNQIEYTGLTFGSEINLTTVATGASQTIGVQIEGTGETSHSAQGADISPATQAGDAVTGWRDQLHVGGAEVTQTTPSKMPVLTSSGSGLVMRTDGADDFLSRAPPTSGPQALIVKLTINSVLGFSLIAGYDDGNGNWNHGLGISIQSGQLLGWSDYYGSFFVLTAIPSGPAVITVLYDAPNGTMELRINGVSIGSGPSGNPSYSGATFFVGSDPTSEAVGADYEAVIITTDLTAVPAIESYLAGL